MVDLMIGRVEKQLKGKDMAMELTDKAKSLLAKRGFDPVLGARPLRRTIQREIEDALSEKILFEEVGPGQLVTVDVDNWDGEGAGEDAVFTFTGTKKPAKRSTNRNWQRPEPPARRARLLRSRQPRHENGRLPLRVAARFQMFRGGSCDTRAGWLDGVFRMLDVIDGRRNLVRIQNGRATVTVRPDARRRP